MHWGRGLAVVAGAVAGWPVLAVTSTYEPGAWPILAWAVGGVVPAVVAGLVTSDLLPPRWRARPARSPGPNGFWAAAVSTASFFAARAYLIASETDAVSYGERPVEGFAGVFGVEFAMSFPGIAIGTTLAFFLAHFVADAGDRRAARRG